MKIDGYGQVLLSEQEAFEALYNGKIDSLADVFVEDIERYNHSRDINADQIPVLKKIEEFENLDDFDKTNQDNWFMPDEYRNFSLVDWLYSKCTDDRQIDRVNEELELFIQYNMLDVLYYCKYLVDTMRSNDCLWGVGRGSSVASYVLFLIGIHKIDSLAYQLDINEFLK